MINKKYMNYIKKELKKEDELVIQYQPTEEEKEYLLKYNIKSEIIIRNCRFLSDEYWESEMCRYYIEK